MPRDFCPAEIRSAIHASHVGACDIRYQPPVPRKPHRRGIHVEIGRRAAPIYAPRVNLERFRYDWRIGFLVREFPAYFLLTPSACGRAGAESASSVKNELFARRTREMTDANVPRDPCSTPPPSRVIHQPRRGSLSRSLSLSLSSLLPAYRDRGSAARTIVRRIARARAR